MGADLYLGEMYHRDSYNCWNTLWVMNLSWWTDVVPKLKDGKLPIADAKWLLGEITERKKSFDFNRPVYNEKYLKHFDENTENLVKMLKKSIKTNEQIECSL